MEQGNSTVTDGKTGMDTPITPNQTPATAEIAATKPGEYRVIRRNGKVTALDVKKGDKILFGKWSGTEVTVDGDDLIIMKESDILGIIG